MNYELKNIFDTSTLPDVESELFDTIIEQGELKKNGGLKLERILSFGAVTPDGEWYDQPWNEWVMVALGQAALQFEEGQEITFRSGDYLFIPAHVRHRVTYTSPDCVWLALHLSEEK